MKTREMKEGLTDLLLCVLSKTKSQPAIPRHFFLHCVTELIEAGFFREIISLAPNKF